MEEKPRTRSAQPKEAAPAFMSSLFAMMDVYLNKILVRPHSHDNQTLSVLGAPLAQTLVSPVARNEWTLSAQSLFAITIESFSFQNYLARNFYNLRFLALFVCFAINFILLFYKVTLFFCFVFFHRNDSSGNSVCVRVYVNMYTLCIHTQNGGIDITHTYIYAYIHTRIYVYKSLSCCIENLAYFAY